MRNLLPLAIAAALWLAPAEAAETADEAPLPETVQADISTREISIQSNFTGIEILIFGSVDYRDAPAGDRREYDVIIVLQGPDDMIVVRRKERMAGIWMNGPGFVYPSVPGFYAVLSSRPLRAVASEQTLQRLGIGINNLGLGRTSSDPKEAAFRSAVKRLKQKELLFQEHDDGVAFVGRSLFRATIDLPVNVPVGRYTTNVYLFRGGELLSTSHGTLEVSKVGFERVIYLLAFNHPFAYGLVAVMLAVMAGLIGWAAFRRE